MSSKVYIIAGGDNTWNYTWWSDKTEWVSFSKEELEIIEDMEIGQCYHKDIESEESVIVVRILG